MARDLAAFLAAATQEEMRLSAALGREAQQRGGLLLATINGEPTHLHWMSRILQDAGFQAAPMGFNVRRMLPPVGAGRAAAGGVQ